MLSGTYRGEVSIFLLRLPFLLWPSMKGSSRAFCLLGPPLGSPGSFQSLLFSIWSLAEHEPWDVPAAWVPLPAYWIPCLRLHTASPPGSGVYHAPGATREVWALAPTLVLIVVCLRILKEDIFYLYISKICPGKVTVPWAKLTVCRSPSIPNRQESHLKTNPGHFHWLLVYKWDYFF